MAAERAAAGNSTGTEADEIERLIRSINHTLFLHTRPQLVEHGLTPQRFHVMIHLYKSSTIHMSALQRRLNITMSTLTSLLDGLEQEGFAERFRNNEDRRKVFVRTTDRGMRTLESIHRYRTRALDDALSALSSGNRARLVSLLRTLEQSLTSATEE